MNVLHALERKVLWLSTWTIHNANHLRSDSDGLKVGGHQASSASLTTILAALYFSGAPARRSRRGQAARQPGVPCDSIPARAADPRQAAALSRLRRRTILPVADQGHGRRRLSTGSVGLGVAQTLFASLAQDYLRAHAWGTDRPEGKMVALIGDAEMDEGNIFEALLEGWKHGLRNTWWVVDYNRQSLDAVVREGLWAKFESMFRNFGWDVVVLRHGRLQEAAFREPGRERLREWIERCPNQLYSVLTFSGGAAWRKRLVDELGDQGELSALLDRRSDAELATLMGNLGGHDLPTLLKAFDAARLHDRPVCFVCYTVKGFGLPLAGHKDNHAGLMTPAQVEVLRDAMAVRPGHEWEPFEGLLLPEVDLRAFLRDVPFARGGPRRYETARIAVPDTLALPARGGGSTQAGFGLIMHEIAKSAGPIADRIVTTSPDVTVSTNLGGWVNRRGLFAREEMADTFRTERIPSTFLWRFLPSGQHLELGIAEMNLFTALSAFGLAGSLFGERLLPVGTLYDPFIERGLDALNYACYQDARFMVVATPSGVTLAPERGAHQSIATPLIGMAQDGLTSFKPAYLDELAVIMRWGFEHMQADEGSSVYLRLSTRVIDQPSRTIDAALASDIASGGYWMRRPGPNATVVIVYTGAMAPEAIAASGLMAEDRRDVGLLAVTSADRLHCGWTAAQRDAEMGGAGRSHVEVLLGAVPQHAALCTVLDGHPATLAWLGSVAGNRTRALGVERFGQTGTIADLHRAHGIDTQGILRAAERIAAGRPIRHLIVA